MAICLTPKKMIDALVGLGCCLLFQLQAEHAGKPEGAVFLQLIHHTHGDIDRNGVINLLDIFLCQDIAVAGAYDACCDITCDDRLNWEDADAFAAAYASALSCSVCAVPPPPPRA